MGTREIMKYKAILADPPWNFKTYSPKGDGRSAKQHYNVMSFDEIKDLGYLKVLDWVAPDCVLFLWDTYPNLKDAFSVMRHWGFEYKTVAFTWVKINQDGVTPFTGMGYWTRANAEICILGTRGHPKRKAKDVRQVILSKRREHSRKPDEQYERIERLVDGPYLEMFARSPHREGWDVWGNEAEDAIN